MDQLIFASLSHTHYWYEVGILKYRRCATYTRMIQSCTVEQPHHILDTVLLLVQGFFKSVGSAGASRIDEHETPALGLQEAASEALNASIAS